MEKLINSDFIIEIEVIERIIIGNRRCEIVFATRDSIYQEPEWYKLVFGYVLTTRYSIEEEFFNRWWKLTQGTVPDSCILRVHDSGQVKAFVSDVPGMHVSGEIESYIVIDKTDTALEILTWGKPKLQRTEQPPEDAFSYMIVTH